MNRTPENDTTVQRGPTPPLADTKAGAGPVPPPVDENDATDTVPDDMEKLLREAQALATYVSSGAASIGDGWEALHKALLDAIANARAEKISENWVALHTAYAAVAAKTYATAEVNGRTIIDTNETFGLSPKSLSNPKYRPLALGMILFALAMLLELLGDWAARIDPKLLKDWTTALHMISAALLKFLIPAAWGGIGACIFLMKRLSDKLFEKSFERDRVRGDMTRVFLGSMLGVVVVVLFFPNFGESVTVANVTLGPATAAFIAGLGVKPIYAAFEELSEGLAKRFPGNKPKKREEPGTSVQGSATQTVPNPAAGS